LQGNIKLKENSWLAKIAAAKMRSDAVALVIGNTIHLYNIAQKQFLQNTPLLKHELCHVRQYMQYGFTFFLVKYLWYSYKYGYYNNPFEVEARAAEES
jgi:hypothetical protein